MSWSIREFVLDGNKTEKEIREAIIDGGFYEGEAQPLVCFNEIVNSEEAASEFVKNHWQKYKNFAIRFRICPEPTKKMLDFENRIKETREKILNYQKTHSVHTFKAKLITCLNCESKLNKDFFRGEVCPLCRAELSSETTIKTIANYEAKISELEEKIRTEKEAAALKSNNLKWYVYAETYVG